jgi:hypothetical protein
MLKQLLRRFRAWLRPQPITVIVQCPDTSALRAWLQSGGGKEILRHFDEQG